MPHNNLRSSIRLVLLVCSLSIIISQSVRAEQHALLVGVWDYENPNLQLDAPPNDLKLMEALLSAHGVPQERMHILKNPNKVQVQHKFRELSRRLNPSDSLIFYFSGHGTQIIDKIGTFPGDEAKGRYPDRNDEALLPMDANLASPKTYLLDDELNILIQDLPTRKVSCIIDTCYSGDILREIRLGRPKGTPVTDTPTAVVQQTQIVSHTEDILDKSADFALLLAAAAYNQVVHELRIPFGNTYLPVSAMTYSLYRQMLSGRQTIAKRATGVQREVSITYRQLVQHVQNDHKQWNLAWHPILEGPENRFDEVFIPTDFIAQPQRTLTLTTIKGQTVEINQQTLALAGGGNFELGPVGGENTRHWAVVIGVDAYPSPFQSLKYAADDAKAVAQVFQNAGVNVTLMTPDSLIQPTKANVIVQLQRHAQLESVDLLTVYLSGHGEDVNGIGYFLPMDVTDSPMNSGLSLENLFAILNRAKAKHRFVIVDACRVTPKEHFVAALSRYSEESNIIFTACDSDQWAPEIPQLKHGLFTYFLLKGLRDSSAAGDDATVTVLGLLDYVTRGIEEWHSHLSEVLPYPQQITPRVFYNGKYISLLHNQGIDPTVLNNQGPDSPGINSIQPSQPARVDKLSSLPSEKNAELHLPLTVSLLPWISTVGLRDLNRNVTTNLSLNIIAGYHARLDGVELGSFLNMKRIDARGAQVALGANIVSGVLDGVQFALGGNVVGRNAEGVQTAFGLNVVGSNLEGVQAAVGGNIVGESARGVQIAFGANLAGRDIHGWQAAYGLNLAVEDVHPRSLQTAVGGNIAGNLKGTQIGLIGNISLGLRPNEGVSEHGTQVAMVNIARGRIGTQIGLLNVAEQVEETQLGVLNVAGRMSGIPFGLVNFVGDNPLHMQFWGSDTEVASLGLRIGSRHTYSLLMIGANPDDAWGRWSPGFGIGAHIPLKQQVFLNADIVTRRVLYSDELSDTVQWSDDSYPNLLSKLRMAIGWEQHKWFSVFGGISFNAFISNPAARDTSDIAYGFDRVYRLGDDHTIRLWPGFFAGVQF